MGLFDKVKSILFEEEEVEEVETPKKKEEVIENSNDEDIDIKDGYTEKQIEEIRRLLLKEWLVI